MYFRFCGLPMCVRSDRAPLLRCTDWSPLLMTLGDLKRVVAVTAFFGLIIIIIIRLWGDASCWWAEEREKRLREEECLYSLAWTATDSLPRTVFVSEFQIAGAEQGALRKCRRRGQLTPRRSCRIAGYGRVVDPGSRFDVLRTLNVCRATRTLYSMP